MWNISSPLHRPSRVLASLTVLVCLTPVIVLGAQSEADRFWPQWRGPRGTGVAPHGDPPLTWSETTNIRWKVEIPGRGSASPIVWGDRVFVLTAIPTGEQAASREGLFGRLVRRFSGGVAPTTVLRFVIRAHDRRDGRLLWERVAREELPHEGSHATGSWASPSAVTDGEIVCAFFGSRGLYCYDMEGDLQWEHDLGDMRIRMGFGEGASPALHQDRIIVNWDHQGDSFITAFDKQTGREIWKVERDEITSWTTPLVVEHGDRAQVVTSATNRVRSYDVETGRLLWQSQGVTMNAIPSPVAADEMVYVTSGFRGSRLMAIRLAAASGEITDSDAIAWSLNRDTPYVPSPLLHDGTLYLLKSNSWILSAYHAATGAKHYGPERLRGIRSVYASPVAAKDRVYITGRGGATLVIRHGPSFGVLATNTLDDDFDASPAIVDGEIYLRGSRYLYCIAES